MQTKRFATYQSVQLQTGSTSPEIDISNFASGEVVIPTAKTVVTLTYYVVAPSGVLYAAQDASGAAVTQTVAADKAYPIPSVLFGASRIQIRGNVADLIGVVLKS